jgi:hypothetical protein
MTSDQTKRELSAAELECVSGAAGNESGGPPGGVITQSGSVGSATGGSGTPTHAPLQGVSGHL